MKHKLAGWSTSWLDEAQTGIQTTGRNINNLRYAYDITLIKAGLKLNIQKATIMASVPITSWQIDGETMETVTDVIFGGSKITADGDCSHEMKRLWCWEGLGAGGEGDYWGWDGWMASRTRWTWVWVNSRRWWWTGRPGVLQFMGLQRVGHDWATELNAEYIMRNTGLDEAQAEIKIARRNLRQTTLPLWQKAKN